MENKKTTSKEKVFIKPDFLLIPLPVYQNNRLDNIDCFVYAVIYWFYSLKDGKCTASNATIANILNLVNYRTVQNALTRLEENGFIKREYQDSKKRIREEIIPLVTFRVSSVDDKVSSVDDTRVSSVDDQNKNIYNENIKEENTVVQNFEKFWHEYPNKKNKKKAFEKFKKINPSEEMFALILEALKKQKKSPQWFKDGGQFIPHPTTWLNGERWNDEISVHKIENVLSADEGKYNNYAN